MGQCFVGVAERTEMSENDLDDLEDPEEDDWWCDYCDINRPNAWQLTGGRWYLICFFCQEKQHKELKDEAKRLNPTGKIY